MWSSLSAARQIIILPAVLVRDPALFEADRLPEAFEYRDAHLDALAFAFALRPQNTALRGVPGTGKTTAVRLLFAEAEETRALIVPAPGVMPPAVLDLVVERPVPTSASASI
ncbi:hypothetical protein RJ40_11910 [Methanofollis aquaemaris]|uniref:Uncharacterized protein n=1 Tax=Methanofollis aquaemaris TaxID=126734 RepID=A0A8A3S792_9EURY|nr:hypothetical protein [Methanofollis aquaemaris]QSZ68147.1 hypothetical protein RJ40_11910 [Methanofollis aquaemaris]